ncbi:MAG: pyrimidine reductase family protein [Actinomycetota bacterium]
MIDRLWPEPAGDLSDDDLVPLPDGEWLRVNLIESIDGAATVDGRSGGLGTDTDHRLFELLRRTSDAVLVGAGTVRAEGYGAMRVSEESSAWRVARGMPAHPVFVIVSGSLDLDPASAIFTGAPVRPVIVTTAGHDTSAFDGLADVVQTGETVDVSEMLARLRARGLARILNEGGPSLFTSLLEAGVVDELRLTVSPLVVGGDGKHITAGSFAKPVEARLAEILYGDGTLLYSYRF